MGMTEFNKFVSDIAELSGLPNNTQLRVVTSKFIFGIRPDVARIPKRIIAQQLRKAAANQVASEVLKIADEEKKQIGKTN